MQKHVYGPVASRRLGRSLGIDLVPSKTCTLNCVYCQLGARAEPTMERKAYVDPEEVCAEVREVLRSGADPDYLTLSGAGEPTLDSHFGDVAGRLQELGDTPVALVTNGTLFHREEVRRGCSAIDLVLPSLDAGDEETFRRLNRPHPDLRLEDIVDGLCRLRDEQNARMWLEVFVVPGINTGTEQVEALARAVERISPDRVQLNTAVRPPTEESVRAAPREQLERVRDKIGPECEIIVPAESIGQGGGSSAAEDILSMLRRRPCTADDVAAGLSISVQQVLKELENLRRRGRVRLSRDGSTVYYRAAD